AVAGATTPDVFPDVIVSALPSGAGNTLDNLFTLAGNGDGTFQAPALYQVGGPGVVLTPSYLAVPPSPLMRVTTSATGGNPVAPPSPGLPGRFGPETGTTSPLSGTAMPAPSQGKYQAVLDEASLLPPLNGANLNAASTYSGSHALYQDVTIPAGATKVVLTFH